MFGVFGKKCHQNSVKINNQLMTPTIYEYKIHSSQKGIEICKKISYNTVHGIVPLVKYFSSQHAVEGI